MMAGSIGSGLVTFCSLRVLLAFHLFSRSYYWLMQCGECVDGYSLHSSRELWVKSSNNSCLSKISHRIAWNRDTQAESLKLSFVSPFLKIWMWVAGPPHVILIFMGLCLSLDHANLFQIHLRHLVLNHICRWDNEGNACQWKRVRSPFLLEYLPRNNSRMLCEL
jgi:hypothetical protein